MLAVIVTLATRFHRDRRRPMVPRPKSVRSRIEAFEREIDGLQRLLSIPGLQVAVVRDDRIVLERAYGYAHLEAKVPMTTDHLIEIASVTKTMTAVVMMQLVAEGKVSLDDRVVKYPFFRWFYPTRITPGGTPPPRAQPHVAEPPGETYLLPGESFRLRLRSLRHGHAGEVSRRGGRGVGSGATSTWNTPLPRPGGQDHRRGSIPPGDALRGGSMPRPASPLPSGIPPRAERSLSFGRFLLERQGPRAVCHRFAESSPDPRKEP